MGRKASSKIKVVLEISAEAYQKLAVDSFNAGMDVNAYMVLKAMGAPIPPKPEVQQMLPTMTPPATPLLTPPTPPVTTPTATAEHGTAPAGTSTGTSASAPTVHAPPAPPVGKGRK